jgi:hypothetical protein
MRSFIAALVLCLLNIPAHAEDCIASVHAIGDSSQPGTETASGIPLDDNAMTAAHKSLRFGSKVKGDQQGEWPFRHDDDHGSRALC